MSDFRKNPVFINSYFMNKKCETFHKIHHKDEMNKIPSHILASLQRGQPIDAHYKLKSHNSVKRVYDITFNNVYQPREYEPKPIDSFDRRNLKYIYIKKKECEIMSDFSEREKPLFINSYFMHKAYETFHKLHLKDQMNKTHFHDLGYSTREQSVTGCYKLKTRNRPNRIFDITFNNVYQPRGTELRQDDSFDKRDKMCININKKRKEDKMHNIFQNIYNVHQWNDTCEKLGHKEYAEKTHVSDTRPNRYPSKNKKDVSLTAKKPKYSSIEYYDGDLDLIPTDNGKLAFLNKKERGINMKNFEMKRLFARLSYSLLSEPMAVVRDTILSKLFYKIDLTRVQYYVSPAILRKYFKHFPFSCDVTISSRYEDGIDITEKGSMKIDKFVDLCIYKNTPVLLHIKPVNELNNVINVFMYTLNNKHDIKVMKSLVKKITSESHSEAIENDRKSLLLGTGIRDYYQYDNFKRRTFDNVFLPEDTRNQILNSVDKYINSYDWYEKNGIPNHFGILLYGKPGMGKSVVAQAIAEHINGQLVMISSDSLSSLQNIITSSGIFQMDPERKDVYKVLLIEDIDCSKLSSSRESMLMTVDGGDNRRLQTEVSLSSILNCLDGVSAPSNVIYIFTTNHVENLDPALIRPGRIDMKIEMKSVEYETFCQFCKFHYNEMPKEHIDIKEGISFGELQLQVMYGKTLSELCKFVSKDDNIDIISTSPSKYPSNYVGNELEGEPDDDIDENKV